MPLPYIDVTRDGDIATVALNHAGKLNAPTVAMWQQLARAMAELSADADLAKFEGR
jgi:enoyl-CoA hydratase/carnithine racemase